MSLFAILVAFVSGLSLVSSTSVSNPAPAVDPATIDPFEALLSSSTEKMPTVADPDLYGSFTTFSLPTYLVLIAVATIGSAIFALVVPQGKSDVTATTAVATPKAVTRAVAELPPNYKTVMCRNIGVCKFGERCHFAHSAAELRILSKTTVSARSTTKAHMEPLAVTSQERLDSAAEIRKLLRVDSRFAALSPSSSSLDRKPTIMALGPKGPGFDPSFCVGRKALARLRHARE